MDITNALATYDMRRDMGSDELRSRESATATLAVEYGIGMHEAREIIKAALLERRNTPTQEVSTL